MTDPLQPTTKLDAVNGMLMSIGQAPVNTLQNTNIRDVNTSILTLDMTLRDVLEQGWWFNTDCDWSLTPDINDNILIPAGALAVDPTDPYYDYVERYDNGTLKLYDRKERTFVIKDKVKCDITWAFEFEECPQVVRSYVYIRAARIWQTQVIASEILFKFTELHEREALAALKRRSRKNADRNILSSATQENIILSRHVNPTR